MTFDPSRLVRDYGNPVAEVLACRRSAALFDFSFIARGRVAGPDAAAVLARLTPRRIDDLAPGHIRYAVRLDAHGCLSADLTIWRHADDSYEVMSGRRSDIADLVRWAGDAGTDLTDATAIFAVQGPRSLDVLVAAGFARPALAQLAYYQFCAAALDGVVCLAGRLGYTGEAGFEIVAPRAIAAPLWDRLSAHARPAGFAAIDTLRIEAGFVLFAHEFRLPVTPGEAGLARFGDAAAADPGGDALALVAFAGDTGQDTMLWQPPAALRRPQRTGAITVTSACWSPHAGSVLGLGYVRRRDLDGAVPLVDPSGQFTALARVPRPFVDRSKQRPRAPWSATVPE